MASKSFRFSSLKQRMNFLVLVSSKYFKWRVKVGWQPLRLQFTRAECCLDHGGSAMDLLVEENRGARALKFCKAGRP